jgi:hypothetical protein
MAFKFRVYMGMPIETEINIPQAAFEVTLEPFLKCQIQRYEQSFIDKKQEQLLEFQKQSVIAGNLSLSAGYNYMDRVHKCLGELNHLMGFWTDFIYRLKLENPYFLRLRLDLKLDKQIFN